SNDIYVAIWTESNTRRQRSCVSPQPIIHQTQTYHSPSKLCFFSILNEKEKSTIGFEGMNTLVE
ncbi:unnamed protein product, partial [Sphenostylis stenocarpa]